MIGTVVLWLVQHMGEGDSHIKTTGVLVGDFEKNPLEDPVLWVWLEIFSPLKEVPVLA